MLNICLVGEIIVDVSLKNRKDDLKMRLGGITHSARALWALSSKFSLGYISPRYLDDRAIEFMNYHGRPDMIKVAETENSPNIILIQETKEIGDQGYELLLRDEVRFKYFDAVLPYCDNILITSGQYDLKNILALSNGKPVSLELANMTYKDFIGLDFKFHNLYLSTSSVIFREYACSEKFDFSRFIKLFEGYCDNLVLKENRGGTRLYSFIQHKTYQNSSQTKPIQHSVGVGDVYNAVFESNIYENIHENLAIASFIAMEYASTTYPVNFKDSVQKLLKVPINELVNIKGTVLNWENRKLINIYIAAPDFDFVDTQLIDRLENSLLYHNFSPRRPIKENGQMESDDSFQRRQSIYTKDHELLMQCSIVIAVLLYNDPGTLVEIGIAAERQVPVLLYDPFNLAKNCMLTQSCKIVTNDMDEIICEVFNYSSNLWKN